MSMKIENRPAKFNLAKRSAMSFMEFINHRLPFKQTFYETGDGKYKFIELIISEAVNIAFNVIENKPNNSPCKKGKLKAGIIQGEPIQLANILELFKPLPPETITITIEFKKE